VLLPEPAIFESYPISLPLIDGTPEELKRHFIFLISKLLGAIDLQKRLIDDNKNKKSQKIGN
jgi:hypothetical protein